MDQLFSIQLEQLKLTYPDNYEQLLKHFFTQQLIQMLHNIFNAIKYQQLEQLKHQLHILDQASIIMTLQKIQYCTQRFIQRLDQENSQKNQYLQLISIIYEVAFAKEIVSTALSSVLVDFESLMKLIAQIEEEQEIQGYKPKYINNSSCNFCQ